jgi:hypothetical protein
MIEKLITISLSAISVLFLSACTSDHTDKVSFGRVKSNISVNSKCLFGYNIVDAKIPKRGVVEGENSFLVFNSTFYAVDFDDKTLSRIVSDAGIADGTMTRKPDKIEKIGLNSSELHAVAALANPIWANPNNTPSHFIFDTSWNINLIDGSAKKCGSGPGRAAGDGERLVDTIYAIWKFHSMDK